MNASIADSGVCRCCRDKAKFIPRVRSGPVCRTIQAEQWLAYGTSRQRAEAALPDSRTWKDPRCRGLCPPAYERLGRQRGRRLERHQNVHDTCMTGWGGMQEKVSKLPVVRPNKPPSYFPRVGPGYSPKGPGLVFANAKLVGEIGRWTNGTLSQTNDAVHLVGSFRGKTEAWPRSALHSIAGIWIWRA